MNSPTYMVNWCHRNCTTWPMMAPTSHKVSASEGTNSPLLYTSHEGSAQTSTNTGSLRIVHRLKRVFVLDNTSVARWSVQVSTPPNPPLASLPRVGEGVGQGQVYITQCYVRSGIFRNSTQPSFSTDYHYDIVLSIWCNKVPFLFQS